MEVKVYIDEEELVRVLTEKVASNLYDHLLGCHHITDWEKREAEQRRVRKKILDSIDWSKTAPQVTEVVVKKFFEQQLKE